MNAAPLPATCVVVGAGQRGCVYSSYAVDFPTKLKVVGVCEPKEIPRSRIQNQHNIPLSRCFYTWEDMLPLGKVADFVIITTQDQLHKAPAVAFAKQGYHILLEKPMAVTAEDCIAIADACDQHEVLLCVCHVLRYSPINRKIKELVVSGAIGDVVSLTHKEPVGYVTLNGCAIGCRLLLTFTLYTEKHLIQACFSQVCRWKSESGLHTYTEMLLPSGVVFRQVPTLCALICTRQLGNREHICAGTAG